ncbi:aminotransferase class IV [Roseivirga misakiensis]|uniref:branched-chain-amino-acid transaminase n=1 Tax=Roseivirga misakiensis TaxID=1563681 RepID=A0A1E5T1M5_9BACT|nr:aminotransferase class IV [Roseivirga misakiensis]OEK05259.1 hypothetical protein BFP71_17825 [Roseivirga misakiensis]
MKAIFNSRIVNTDDQVVKTTNRSYCYGDGLFETIVTGPERINLIGYHVNRLEQACHVMGIDFPVDLSSDRVDKMVQELRAFNGIEGVSRSKLSLWRNEGGLYSPTENSASFYLETSPTESQVYRPLQEIGLSANYHTLYSPISFAKTSNALTYVLAGREKQSQSWDDIILTDVNGNIAETHIGNIFWVIDSKIFTPKLTTGCIEGIMRRYTLEFFRKNGSPIIETEAPIKDLEDAQSIFMTNASGIRYFKSYKAQHLQNPNAVLEELIKRLQQP